MRKIKVVKCPCCTRTFKKPDSWCNHMSTKHPDDIPEGYTPMRYLYGIITGKYKGECMYCSNETEWNESAGKYSRLCGSASCRDKYAKDHQLLSPEKQRAMLANRKISSIYSYDGVDIAYTGTYELKFLQFMQNVLNWPASDILSPSPNTYYYEYENPDDPYHEGTKFYIPDFYIPSLNLEIEIKDHTTTHPKFLRIDRIKEACKDKRMEQVSGKVNYFKISDNKFGPFVDYLQGLKLNFDSKEMLYAKLKEAKRIAEEKSKATESVSYDTEYIDTLARELTRDAEAINWMNDTHLTLITYCDNVEDLDRIWEEFNEMNGDSKSKSDLQSIELYGVDNETHYKQLRDAILQTNIRLPHIPDFGEGFEGGTEGYVKDYTTDIVDVINDGIGNAASNAKMMAYIQKNVADIKHMVVDVILSNPENYDHILEGATYIGHIPYFILYLKTCSEPFALILNNENVEINKLAGLYMGNSEESLAHGIVKLGNAKRCEEDCYCGEQTFISYYDSADGNPVFENAHNATREYPALNLNAQIYKIESMEDIMSALELISESQCAVEAFTTTDHNIFTSGNGFMDFKDIIADRIKAMAKIPEVKVYDGKIHIKNLFVHNLFTRMNRYYGSKSVKNIFMIDYDPKSLEKYQAKKISRDQIKIKELQCPVFFALELTEIFKDLGAHYGDKTYLNIAKDIYDNTWLSGIETKNPEPLNLSNLSNIGYDLLPHQKEFIANYPKLKASLNLEGYILAFDQGLGKTLTAVAIGECGEYDNVYIICPNPLMKNWASEIRSYFSKYEDPEVYTREVILCKETKGPKKDGKYFIINNESIGLMEPFIKKGKNLLIIDESHNFRNVGGKRAQELFDIQKKIKPSDTLLLSGTPIKAIPAEITPALMLIDPLMTEEAAALYNKAFKIDNISASDMISKRFGKVIYRKDKSILKDLPKKNINEIYLEVTNAEKYLVDSLNGEILSLFKRIYGQAVRENERLNFEMRHYVIKYAEKADGVDVYLKWLNTVNTANDPRLHDYEKDIVENFLNKEVYPRVQDATEMARIRELERVFVHMKTSALSKAIGAIIPPARRELFIALFEENIDKFISDIVNCEKKTVIFSQFKPVVKYISKRLSENGIENVCIHGDNPKDRADLVEQFKAVDTCRCLVATSDTMGTGFTLVEASQMFFFGPPWRDSDFNQCCDRIHRIGQKTDVEITIVSLDTGSKLNISTRMSEIMNWSKEMFDSAISITDVLEFENELVSMEAMERYYGAHEEFHIAMEGLIFSHTQYLNLENLHLREGCNVLHVGSDSLTFCQQIPILGKYADVVYIDVDNCLFNYNNEDLYAGLKKNVKDYDMRSRRFFNNCKNKKRYNEDNGSYTHDVLLALYALADQNPGTVFVLYGLSIVFVYNTLLVDLPIAIEDYSVLDQRINGNKNRSDVSHWLYRNDNHKRWRVETFLKQTDENINLRRMQLKPAQINKTKFYHITNDKDIKTLIPRVPKSIAGNENMSIARSCVSSSIVGCFIALPEGRVRRGEVIYIYEAIPTEKTRILRPNADLVYDVDYTGECWILDDVALKFVTAVVITKVIGDDEEDKDECWGADHLEVHAIYVDDKKVADDLKAHPKKVNTFMESNKSEVLFDVDDVKNFRVGK